MSRSMTAKIKVTPYMVYHAMMNKTEKTTDNVPVGHMHQLSIKNTKTDYDIYVWLERRHTGYLTKKVVTHVVAVYHKL